MPAPTLSRNNVLAGLFVIASLILAVFVSVLVSGVQKRLIPVHDYTIRFSLIDGVSTLKPGAIVAVGGKEAGRVEEMQFERPTPDAMPTGVVVRVSVYRSVALATDAVAFLERPLLGSIGSINIIRPGSAAGTAMALAPGSTLQGVIAPPSFLAQAGFGPEQAKQVQNIFTRANDVVERVDRMSSRLETEFDPVVKSLRQASEDAADVTRRVRERTPDWTQQVDQFLARAQQAADDAAAGIKDARATLDANRPAIDRTFANVEQITSDVRTTSVPLLNETLTAGRDGAAEFRTTIREVAELLREQEPNLRRALANFRLASDQIKLTTVEVRRSPWRLLYQPGTKELESELFYDAARTYAEAVSDLRAASESLEALTAAVPLGNGIAPATAPGVDADQLATLKAELTRAFERYNAAEKKLLDRMLERAP